METSEDYIKRKIAKFESERGKPAVRVKDIGRKGWHLWEREAWTFMVQHNLPHKVFVIERFQKYGEEGEIAYEGAKIGDREYRIGYCIRGQIGNKNGKWTWGQYCPFIPVDDLLPLLEKAKKEATLLF